MRSLNTALLIIGLCFTGMTLAASPAAQPSAVSPSTRYQMTGTVETVTGGRVAIRLPDGSLRHYTLQNQPVQEGQTIQAAVERLGDADVIFDIQTVTTPARKTP